MWKVWLELQLRECDPLANSWQVEIHVAATSSVLTLSFLVLPLTCVDYLTAWVIGISLFALSVMWQHCDK